MESILNLTGTCGYSQTIHVICAQLPRFLAAWALTFMMFGAFNPGWRCSRDDRTDVYSSSNLSNAYLTKHNSSLVLSEELDDRLRYGNDNVTTLGQAFNGLAAYNGTCDTVGYCEGGVAFNPSSSTVTTEFELICDRVWLLRAILLVQGAGCLIVSILAGQVGDKFSRKFSLYGCAAIICVFSGLALASHNWIMFATCYFFIGGAGNSILGISPLFSLEMLNSKWRGYFNSIPTANIAMFLFTIVSYLVKDWFVLHIISCAMAFGSCIGFLLLPESPRWLVVKGETIKAEEAILNIAKFSRKDRIDRASFKEFHEAVKKEATTDKAYSLVDLFRNKKLTIRAIKFFILFLCLSLTYSSITFGLSALPGNYYTNAISATWIEIVFVIASGPLCNVFGRRCTGLACGVVAIVSCITIDITLSSTEEGTNTRNWIVNVFAFFAKSLSQVMFCVGTTLNIELFPAVARSAVGGVMRCSVGIGVLIMPFLLPSKDDSSLTVFFGLLCAFYLVTCVIFLSFPETNRHNLTDGLLGGGDGYDGGDGGGCGGGGGRGVDEDEQMDTFVSVDDNDNNEKGSDDIGDAGEKNSAHQRNDGEGSGTNAIAYNKDDDDGHISVGDHHCAEDKDIKTNDDVFTLL